LGRYSSYSGQVYPVKAVLAPSDDESWSAELVGRPISCRRPLRHVSSGRFNFLRSDTAAVLIDCALLTKIYLPCVTL